MSQDKTMMQPPSAPTLNEVFTPAAQSLNDAHPLESRVANWRANEEAFKLKLLQRSFGAAEPIKRTMETQIVEQSSFVPGLVGGPSNVHLDILRNNDASLDWEDVYADEAPGADFHQELQRRMNI